LPRCIWGGGKTGHVGSCPVVKRRYPSERRSGGTTGKDFRKKQPCARGGRKGLRTVIRPSLRRSAPLVDKKLGRGKRGTREVSTLSESL